MRKPGTSARAIAILAGAAAAAFAVSTAAVSSATTSQAPNVATVKFPFAKFSFTGGVSTARPARPATFALNFKTSFTLNSRSPGLVDPTTGTLDNITITEQVAYPIPGGRFVGPVRLPFRSETLLLSVTLKGTCFVPQPNGEFRFRDGQRCVTSTLKLGSKTYKVSALLVTADGSVVPSPTGAPQWTSTMRATFRNPGYTFPVATLGSGGFTALTIGSNGGKLATRSVTFAG